jgi:NhaP-type Na+/H+ or K+/H+ antiporter
MALFSVSVGVLVGWVAFRLRRRVRNLRNLRKSFVGAMTAQTLIQLEHHKGQGKAALRDLIANR